MRTHFDAGDVLVGSAVAAAVLMWTVGCGGGGARVSGRVTLDGRALETGSVQFHPAAGGPVAYGSIGPQGRFTLAVGASAGAVPSGRYVATVVAVAPASAAASDDAESVPVPITPTRYGDVATSGLAFDLAAGRNEITIELSSEAPVGLP